MIHEGEIGRDIADRVITHSRSLAALFIIILFTLHYTNCPHAIAALLTHCVSAPIHTPTHPQSTYTQKNTYSMYMPYALPNRQRRLARKRKSESTDTSSTSHTTETTTDGRRRRIIWTGTDKRDWEIWQKVDGRFGVTILDETGRQVIWTRKRETGRLEMGDMRGDWMLGFEGRGAEEVWIVDRVGVVMKARLAEDLEYEQAHRAPDRQTHRAADTEGERGLDDLADGVYDGVKWGRRVGGEVLDEVEDGVRWGKRRAKRTGRRVRRGAQDLVGSSRSRTSASVGSERRGYFTERLYDDDYEHYRSSDEEDDNHTNARRQFLPDGRLDPDYIRRLHDHNSPFLNQPYSDMLTNTRPQTAQETLLERKTDDGGEIIVMYRGLRDGARGKLKMRLERNQDWLKERFVDENGKVMARIWYNEKVGERVIGGRRREIGYRLRLESGVSAVTIVAAIVARLCMVANMEGL